MLSRLTQTRNLLLALLIFPVALTAAPQKPSLDGVLDGLFAAAGFHQVEISPDGQRVAWVVTLHRANGSPSPELRYLRGQPGLTCRRASADNAGRRTAPPIKEDDRMVA